MNTIVTDRKQAHIKEAEILPILTMNTVQKRVRTIQTALLRPNTISTGRRSEHLKPMAIQRLLMTNTEQKQEVIRKTVTVRPHNIINTDKKSEHLSNERG